MEDFVNCGNINIKKESCIRTTFSKSHCRDCEDICIVDAIVFSPEVSINKNICIRCGLCYSACKFSAISIKKDDKQLIKETQNSNTVDIGCIFSNSEIKIACISRITEDLLAYWFANKKSVKIKKGNCKRCKFKDTLKYFNNSVKKAVIISRAIGLKPEITIKTDKSEKVYIPKESVSRRKIFSGFSIVPSNSEPKRTIIRDIVKNNIINDLPYPDSADLSINSSCTLCGVCAHICPPKAIRITKHEEGGYIRFLPSLCINCKECIKACLYDSITITKSGVSSLVAQPKTVFKAIKKVCKICKKEFYTTNEDEELCRVCSLKENEKQNFLNFLKNL